MSEPQKSFKFSQFLAKRLRRVADKLDSLTEPPEPEAQPSLAEYVDAAAFSSRNAVDALQGWNMALPAEAGAVAGLGAFYNDPRILWAMEQYGLLEGRKILELGPLEASHTYMLEQRHPASILAVEANRLSYLRCLVVKGASRTAHCKIPTREISLPFFGALTSERF